MSNNQIRIECMADLFEELQIKATPEQIESIVKDFMHHLDMEQEMSNYQHVGHKPECDKCRKMQSEIDELKYENKVFRNSVKQRRGAERVWIQNDTVMYEK